ncbi:MAG: hypothetical protein ACK4RZ_12285 [Paracoccaceae bacterium]
MPDKTAGQGPFARLTVAKSFFMRLLTGASRAVIQRNLACMEVRGLIREVTGQGRFRMWR